LHPYTCGLCGESLTAYRDGWHCDYCHQYKQDWAHTVDCCGSILPNPIPDPFLDSNLKPYIGEAKVDMSKHKDFKRPDTWI
jgi:hypothetical protein